jgi:DNA-3-methyladenine glycosylase II
MKSCFEAEIVRATAHLADADAVMGEVIAAVGPCGLSPAWQSEPFESLVRAVVSQQLQRKAAQAIFGRFLALFSPAPFPTPAQLLAVDNAVLRGVGLSQNKILAMRDIAAKAQAGIVPTRLAAEVLSDAELIGQLIVIRGVGQWTVEMLLIFTMGRLDVFPVDDFGVRKGMKTAFGLDAMPAKREMLARAELWRPYRSVASWYMWRLAGGAPAVRPENPRDTEPGPERTEIERRDWAGRGQDAPARSRTRR